MKSIYYLLLILFSFGVPLHSQVLQNMNTRDFNSITVEDGLSQNTVHCILRSSEGYVWFGTDHGLSRFDSRKTIQIESFGDDPKDITNAIIYDLVEDENRDVIWASSNKGLLMYSPQLERLTEFDPSKFQVDNISIYDIEIDRNGNLWLASSDGLFLIDPDVGIIEEYRHKPYQSQSISNSQVYSVKSDRNTLWIGTRDGINIFDKSNKSFQRFQVSAITGQNLSQNAIRKVILLKDGTVAIGTEFNGLVLYNPLNGNARLFNVENGKLPHNDVRDIFENSKDEILLAVNGGGFCRINPVDGTTEVIKHNSQNGKSLSTNAIYSVMEDEQGVLWLGTYMAGVFFNNSGDINFKNIRQQHYPSGTICGNRMRSLFVDQEKNLWMGTLSGVTMYNPSKKSFSSFTTDQGNNKTLTFGTVTSVFEDSRGWMWIGTYSGGVNLLKSKSGPMLHIRKDGPKDFSVGGDNIYCFAEDRDDNIWIGTSSGLDKYNSNTGKITNYLDMDVRDIKITDDGVIYMAVMGGVVQMNASNPTPRFLGTIEIAQFPVNEIFLESNNSIWFASQGGGFGNIKIKENEFKIFTEKNGLPSNYISSIVPVSDSVFWLSTYRGLSRFKIKDKTIQNFDLSDGLPCYEFYPRSSVVLSTGEIAFGGSNGIVFFNPAQFNSRKRELPEILLTSLMINNKKIQVGAKESPLNQSITFTNNLKLKFSQRDFAFDFVGLNYKYPDGGEYEYLLEGYSSNWISVGENRTIYFTNLNPGKYKLRLRSKFAPDLRYVKLSNEKVFSINIKSPFWRTRWFLAILFLSIVGLILMIQKYRLIPVAQKRKIEMDRIEYERQYRFNQMRLRFFTNISHELRTPLTLIRGPLDRLMALSNDDEQVRLIRLMLNGSGRLLRLVNQLLDFRKIENDALELAISKVNIKDALKDIGASFESMAQQKNMTFEFDLDNVGETVWVDLDKIEKILYNLLGNAFKYSGEGANVRLKAAMDGRENQNLILTVSDNGKGIPKDKTEKIFERYYQNTKGIAPGGVGIGLTVVKNLVELHKGSIVLNSDLGKGAEFTVVLPAEKAFYEEKDIIELTAGEEEIHHLPDLPYLDLDPVVKPTEVKHDKSIPKILVVDDEPEMLSYLVEVLNPHFRILTAGNGEIGYEIALNQKPDLILSDTVMPDLDGIGFCKKVKGNEKIGHIPFLFLSAWTSEDFKMQGLETGADDYLTKPFSDRLLVAKLTNIIENRRKLKKASRKIVKIQPEKHEIVTSDEQFIRDAQQTIEKYVDDSTFTSKKFREEMNMSHSLLYRKLKELTGFSSNEFIRDYRLKRAAQILMQDNKLTFMEICVQTGFGDAKYFSQCFKRKFGITPSIFASKTKEEQEDIIDI